MDKQRLRNLLEEEGVKTASREPGLVREASLTSLERAIDTAMTKMGEQKVLNFLRAFVDNY